MGKQLTRTVHLFDDKGRRHVFTPDDEVPDWAAKRITNPSAWADGEKSPAPAEDEAPADQEPETEETDESTDGDGAAEESDEESDDSAAAVDAAEPPRSGKGSGKGPWAEYASVIGVDFPEDASAKEIQAAVDAHKGA